MKQLNTPGTCKQHKACMEEIKFQCGISKVSISEMDDYCGQKLMKITEKMNKIIRVMRNTRTLHSLNTEWSSLGNLDHLLKMGHILGHRDRTVTNFTKESFYRLQSLITNK